MDADFQIQNGKTGLKRGHKGMTPSPRIRFGILLLLRTAGQAEAKFTAKIS